MEMIDQKAPLWVWKRVRSSGSLSQNGRGWKGPLWVI